MKRATRGNGLLEPALAALRRRRAERLISKGDRAGRILDIGCGACPHFLEQTTFREKYGVDQLPSQRPMKGIRVERCNLERSPNLPFADAFFNVVTMLAVIEHLQDRAARAVLDESLRVLKQGGRLIVTTPAVHSDTILRAMATFRLVSPEEVEEHVNMFSRERLEAALVEAGFRSVRVGYFELGLNLWASAEK